jgi:enoyl-CoA hydratase/carnithine racemase
VSDLVLLEPVGEGVLRLTLNRPAALNALNRELTAALEETLARVAATDDARVLVVAGRGRAFCAGNDIKEMPHLGHDEAEALSRRWARITERFARLPQVTIAAVHGYALGGGCILAAAQDLRIAAASARFGLPEVTLGFNPSYGIARLIDIVGGGPARDLLLTGRAIGAHDALRIGLVTEVVADDAIGAAAEALAAHLAALPRAGLSATKAVVADIRDGRPGIEAQAYAAALRTEAGARARIAAFSRRRSGGGSHPDATSTGEERAH